MKTGAGLSTETSQVAHPIMRKSELRQVPPEFYCAWHYFILMRAVTLNVHRALCGHKYVTPAGSAPYVARVPKPVRRPT